MRRCVPRFSSLAAYDLLTSSVAKSTAGFSSTAKHLMRNSSPVEWFENSGLVFVTSQPAQEHARMLVNGDDFVCIRLSASQFSAGILRHQLNLILAEFDRFASGYEEYADCLFDVGCGFVLGRILIGLEDRELHCHPRRRTSAYARSALQPLRRAGYAARGLLHMMHYGEYACQVVRNMLYVASVVSTTSNTHEQKESRSYHSQTYW